MVAKSNLYKHRLSANVRATIKTAKKAGDITGAQAKALRGELRHPGAGVSKLTKKAGISTMTVNKQAARSAKGKTYKNQTPGTNGSTPGSSTNGATTGDDNTTKVYPAATDRNRRKFGYGSGGQGF